MEKEETTREVLNRILGRIEKKDFTASNRDSMTQIVYSELVKLVGIDEARKDRNIWR